MPLSGRDAMVLCVLVCCVPVQYWLTQRSTFTSDQREAEVSRLLQQVHMLTNSWFSVTSWREWIISIQRKYTVKDYSHWYDLDDDNPEGECPAVEVLTHRSPDGTFAMSPKPRHYRPKGLRWRVGQVVVHKIWGYKGVIIGWDLMAKAPESWIKQMHKKNKHWKEQPNFALLVDTGDMPLPQVTYVPQENISPIKDTQVDHPDVHQYFDYFDGAQYVPAPWLRTIYPRD